MPQKNTPRAEPQQGVRGSNAKSLQSNPSALTKQEGGDHYKRMKIQPIEYIHANNLGFSEGNVVKLVSRWRNKNGIEDLKKARHHIDLLIELEERKGES